MADQDDAFQPQTVDDRRNVLAEGGKRPFVAILPRISMSCEIESHYSMDLGEGVELFLPVATVTQPAVHEDHRDRPLTGHLITDQDSVRRPDGAGDPFERLFGSRVAGRQTDSDA
jgi:hypothetical protein